MSVDTVDSLKARRNGRGAKPNIRYAPARQTTEEYLAELARIRRKAAGLDEPPTREFRWKVYHLALGVLLLVAACVGLLAR